jgi:hypothetical protein
VYPGIWAAGGGCHSEARRPVGDMGMSFVSGVGAAGRPIADGSSASWVMHGDGASCLHREVGFER